ncbi:MAG: zf-HC2 domain-containing protein [Acidobacteriota bacterium]|nr:zf-HC2 domain-containing protein [Acidobacteriota bacterium]
MRCQELKEILDSYLGDELLVETNHGVLKHLEDCPACRRELTARRELRTRLRSAVKNSPDVQISSIFARRLHNDLRGQAFRPTLSERFRIGGIFGNSAILAAAFGLLLLVFGGWFFLRSTAAPDIAGLPAQTNRTSQASQTSQTNGAPRPAESPIVQAVQIAWRELTEHAVGDHKNCAIKFNLPEKPITLTEAAEKYGKYNKDLDQAVTAPLREVFGSKASEKVKLLAAHSCVFDGRRFAHVVLGYHQAEISVLITDTDLPVENNGIVNNQFDGALRVTSFRTAHHAIFVVSDLTEKDNATIAEAILTSVSRHIERVGA